MAKLKLKIMKPGLLAARRRWKDAIWIIGSGEYASLSYCNDQPTVMLFGTQMEAEIAKLCIDDTGCGGNCRRRHEVVYLGKGRGLFKISPDEVRQIAKRTVGSKM